ncbi:tyrosine-type recombinase/integrase [Paenibacillus rhizosphaerae]|uniref:tyrosine-type recombinase/integrase n=1 Tax=Paenibacillus rhizosphaerae TaxID=297318 RepID=UPI0035E434AB
MPPGVLILPSPLAHSREAFDSLPCSLLGSDILRTEWIGIDLPLDPSSRRIHIYPTDLTPFYLNRYGKHYSLPSLSSALSRYMEAAGLKTIKLQRVTPHFLRHYFAQAARAAGASVSDIAETLEHESERTTKENQFAYTTKKGKGC